MLRIIFAGFLLLILGRSAVRADFIVNGSFEQPVVYTAPNPVNRIMQINAGQTVPGFGWNVTSGNIEVKGFGYVGGSGNLPFDGSAYTGKQWVDLDGVAPGAIAQSFTTVAGQKYAVGFAYANNPYPVAGQVSSALVTVRDTASSKDLLAPLSISHQGATPTDYHWTLESPLLFTATGSNTTLSFASTDIPTSASGIFLDTVSMAAVPEPTGLVLIGMGLSVILAVFVRHRRVVQTA